MSEDAHVDDLVPLYCLGVLSLVEQERVAAHLAVCDDCRVRLDEFRATGDWSTPAPPLEAPPAHLRLRLLEQVRAERRARSSQPAAGWRLPTVATVGLSLLLLVTSFIEPDPVSPTLEQPTPIARGDTNTPTAILPTSLGDQRASLVALQLTSPDAESWPSWELSANRQGRSVTLTIEQLKVLPTDRTYQIWLTDDDRRWPAGIFQADEGGQVTLTIPLPTELQERCTLRVTIEPADGSPEPTGETVLAASL